MTALAQVAYSSRAVQPLSDAQMDHLLLDARCFNLSVGVTGALLHHAGSFFQYFEGPKAGVDEVYARIRASSLHHGLHQLLAAPTDLLHFKAWHMGFAQVSRSTVQIVSQAEWLSVRSSLQATPTAPPMAPGLRLLLKFWHDATRELG